MAEMPLRRETVEELLGENPRAVVDLVLQQAELIVEQRQLIEKQQAALGALEKRVEQLEEALHRSAATNRFLVRAAPLATILE
jgi:sugar diacid utilization regulator